MPEILLGLGGLQALAICAALVVASLLRAFTGFGFALAAVPALSLFLVPTEAVVVSAALTLVANLTGIRSYGADYPPLQLWPVILPSVVGAGVGVAFFAGLSVVQFQLLIGPCVLLACVLLTLYRPQPKSRGTPQRRPGAMLCGFLSGLMNGAFAIPGPPVVLYAMATESDARRSRAFLMYFFMFSALIALVLFAIAGYLTGRTAYLVLLALPAMAVGDQLGLRLFRRHGSRAYRTVALLLMYGIGIAITARGVLSGGWLPTA